MTRSILVSLCLLTSAASADPEHPITAAERSELVTKLGTALERYYVFPDKGRVLEQALRSRLAHGDYAAISTGERLAAAISTELAALVHDKHLEVRYVDAPPPPSPPPSSPASADPEEAAEHRYQNYGVTEVRRLKFNLGYVNFTMFGRPTATAGDKLAAAMRLVADTAALVVDLRDCHGGDTDTVTLAESYFIPAGTHLADMYTRDDGKTERTVAADKLAGPRYPADKPVFVLIGRDTASGCEAFAYAMQSHKRATLIGGRTVGAAHFGAPRHIAGHFMAFIPVGRPIDPITHGNWEGTGVTPTMAVEPARAVDSAELAALRVLAPREPSPRRQAAMQKRIGELEAGH